MTEALLVVKGGAGSGEHPLDRELTVGREDGVDLVIADPEMSRRHAAFRHSGAAVTVEDLGSSNGTWVNGEQISGPAELASGDQIQIGATVFELHDGGAATNVIGGAVAGAAATEIQPGSAARRDPAPEPPAPARRRQPRPAPRQPAPAEVGRLNDPSRQNIAALAAIILGPLSIVLVLFSSGGAFYVALPMAIGAIVCGSIGMRKVDAGKADQGRGLAHAGRITGIIGAILATLAIVALVIVAAALDEGAENLREVIDAVETEIDDAGGDAGDLIDQGSDAAGSGIDQGSDAADGGLEAPEPSQ